MKKNKIILMLLALVLATAYVLLGELLSLAPGSKSSIYSPHSCYLKNFYSLNFSAEGVNKCNKELLDDAADKIKDFPVE